MSDPARILLVEDDGSIQRSLGVLLERQGYDVRPALGGREALAAASAWHPDLVVLDLGLPDLDGVEVCRRLRSDSKVLHHRLPVT